MMYKDYDGNWNDAPCEIEMGSICEFGATAAKLCQPQNAKGKEIIKLMHDSILDQSFDTIFY